MVRRPLRPTPSFVSSSTLAIVMPPACPAILASSILQCMLPSPSGSILLRNTKGASDRWRCALDGLPGGLSKRRPHSPTSGESRDGDATTRCGGVVCGERRCHSNTGGMFRSDDGVCGSGGAAPAAAAADAATAPTAAAGSARARPDAPVGGAQLGQAQTQVP